MSQNKYAGTETEKNLKTAFSGESEARNKYTFFCLCCQKRGIRADCRIIPKNSR